MPYLAPQITVMNHLMLNAFYDSVNKGLGPTLTWVFFFLMIIELLYVTIKYADGSVDEKK
jgi:amino acid permease